MEKGSKFPDWLELLSDQCAYPRPPELAETRVAIHSGKLGDIIYALPTTEALGVTHLLINVLDPHDNPLRVFPRRAAEDLISLLFSQKKISRVSIVRSKIDPDELPPIYEGIYNLDWFRNVARNRAASMVPPALANYFQGDPPAHLGELCSATFGFAVNLQEPWLDVSPSPVSAGKIVVSITQNWRSYPDAYWGKILSGLPDLLFVGHPREWEAVSQLKLPFYPTADHAELARLIAGAKLFLGTVSFPYALAEAIKVPRLVEVCFRNLNAFPIGPRGSKLPRNAWLARKRIANVLNLPPEHQYRKKTARLALHPYEWMRGALNFFQSLITVANQPRPRALFLWLRGSRFRAPLNFD